MIEPPAPVGRPGPFPEPPAPGETAGPGGPAGRPRLGVGALAVVFIAESLALALFQLPMSLSWVTFAFMDQGANLSVQTMLDRGLVPTVDFGYTYGLLPLLLGRAWFAALGRTPAAYAGAMVVFDVLIAWGLARCVAALRGGPAAVALVVGAMLWATLASYINLAHACEATLLCHALAEHALGRRPRALALSTACLFCKPVMAYVYGFLLLLLIVRDGRSGGARGLIRAVVPAAATGAVLLALTVGRFGVRPVVNSLLPLTGAVNYRYMDYGFFHGVGRRFWLPEEVRPGYYVFSPAGHYLLGTVVLAAAAAGSVVRLVRRPARATGTVDEVVACCGVMHLTFLTTFYAALMSWTYYYDILIVGLAGLAGRGRRGAVAVALIAAAALVGQRYPSGYIRSHWRTHRPAADTAGLWADAVERDEWDTVRRLLGDGTGSVLTTQGGCLELLVPGFAPAEDVFVARGIPLPGELRRKLDQVAAAGTVVVRDYTNHKPFLDQWPEFRAALDGFDLAWSSPRYLVFRRRDPPPTYRDRALHEHRVQDPSLDRR